MENQEILMEDIHLKRPGPNFVSTRHRDAISLTSDEGAPRIGRRESEPHSIEINYLYDVLKVNFPNHRVTWDLHHYLNSDFGEINIQFDVSFFKDLQIPYTLSSYEGKKFENRVPDLAINILSKSTWEKDIGKNLDKCRVLQIPVYVIFPSYHVATKIYKPPFMRVYILQDTGNYEMIDLRDVAIVEDAEGNTIEKNPKAIIDVSHILPFRLGLLKRNQEHDGGLPLFRVVLIKPDIFELFLTSLEIERAEKLNQRGRAEKAEGKLSVTEGKLSMAEKEIDDLKKQLASKK